MTREEAIKVLQRMKYPYKCNKRKMIISNVDRDNEALEMAISALENHDEFMKRSYAQGKADAQKPCDDAISRKKAIYVISACDGKSSQIEALEQLPSITQKSGKWIEHPEIETSTPEYLMFYECSECGDKQCFCKSDIHKKRFCSNCGARMVEPQERSDKE